MGIAPSFPEAFSKSQDAAYGGLPRSGTVFVSVADRDKRAVILPILRLSQMGFELIATEGTAETLGRYGIATTVIRKHTEADLESEGPSIVDLIHAGSIDMVINTPGVEAPEPMVMKSAPRPWRQIRLCSPRLRNWALRWPLWSSNPTRLR